MVPVHHPPPTTNTTMYSMRVLVCSASLTDGLMLKMTRREEEQFKEVKEVHNEIGARSTELDAYCCVFLHTA